MPFVPAGKRPLAFLDCETTGLDTYHHEVVEIGIIREDLDGTLTEWHTLVKPERPEKGEEIALKISGYAENPDRWNKAPLMADIGAEVLTQLKGCVIVGQNVSYDLAILEQCLKRSGVNTEMLPYHKIDTVTLIFEHLVPCGLGALSLGKAFKFLGWTQDNAHTALGDARDVHRLYHTLIRASNEDRKRWNKA